MVDPGAAFRTSILIGLPQGQSTGNSLFQLLEVFDVSLIMKRSLRP